MEEIRQRLDITERDIAWLKKGYDEMRSELKNLTVMTSGQNIELKTQSGQLGTIIRWQENAGRLLWSIVTPLLGMVGLGLVVLIGLLAWKGIKT